VTPTDPSVALGLTRQFTATGTFDDGSTKDLTTQVTWTASPNAVISNADPTEGLATGTNVGTSTITATLGTVSGSTTLTITPAVVTAIIVDPQNATINTPVTVAFTATANGIATFMVLGGGLFAGLLGQVGHGIGNRSLEHAAHIVSWALPFEALYQAALSLTTADQVGLTRFLVRLGPLGGGDPAGVWLLPYVAGYLVAVAVVAMAATARRDL